MSRHKFTEDERRLLEGNKNIKEVHNSNVEYTDAFKAYALNAFAQGGELAGEIFSRAGVPGWLNRDRYALQTMRRWREQMKGPSTRGRGRPKATIKSPDEMTLEELRARLAYVEAENEFLKKIHAL